ncbi:MAG: YdaU family protein [Oscillospiraceae bacterium]|jgi:uncharacterized protein YdaU (DUF1376 family)|nr:YdaU family protein [Oscillospiraceae bacterium]
MGNKDPAFLFYSSDFLTGTILFSDEQVGKYIRLMCIQHQQGRLEEADIIKICGSLDNKIMSKFIKDDDGLFYNRRLEAEIQKRASHSRKQQDNVSKRWNENTKPIPNEYQTHTKRIPLENENENENINEDEIKRKIGGYGGKENNSSASLFEQFWKAYPKKKSKGDAEKAWKAIKPNSELLTKMLTSIERAKTCSEWQKDGGQFIPYPASWLRAKGWEDELTDNAGKGGYSGGAKNKPDFTDSSRYRSEESRHLF